MRRKLVVLGLVGLSAGLLAVSACVGDAPAGGGSGNDAGPATDAGPNGVSDSSVATDGGGGGGDNDSSAPSACAAAVTGAYANSGALPFYGSHHGVAGTSDGWAYVGYHHQHGSISYGPDAAAVGDPNDPTEGATAARLDAQGNVIWQQVFSGTSSDEFTALAVDESDNVYAVGWFESPTITLGSTTLTNPTNGAAQGMVVKLDGKTGAPQWARLFVSGAFGYGCGSADYANGRLVVACSMGQSQAYTGASGTAATLTSGGASASAVYALNPANGEAIWADSFSTGDGTNTNFGTSVDSVDVTDSTVVVAGTFTSSGPTDHLVDKTAVDLAPTGGLATGFVAELTADNGLYHFATPFGGSADAGTIQTVAAAGTSMDGGIFVGGAFAGTVTFAAPHTSVGGSADAFVFLLDNKTAPPSWEKTFGGTASEGISGVLIDGCGRPEVRLSAGSSLGTIDGVKMPPAGNGPARIVAKLSSAGALLWASGTANGGNEDLNGINPWGFGIDKNGRTRIVGDFRGQIDFGSGEVTVGKSGSTPYFIEYAP